MSERLFLSPNESETPSTRAWVNSITRALMLKRATYRMGDRQNRPRARNRSNGIHRVLDALTPAAHSD
jgi:hypothetical protein